MELKPDKCKCGANARIRFKGEYAWVECSNKKCDMRTGYIHFIHDRKCDIESIVREQAVNLWNREVRK